MALQITVKVAPSSGRQQWILDKSGMLKCFLKSAPERNRANEELVDFLAASLQVPKSKISLVGGMTSRTKRLSLSLDLTYEHMLHLLGLQQPDKQQRLF